MLIREQAKLFIYISCVFMLKKLYFDSFVQNTNTSYEGDSQINFSSLHHSHGCATLYLICVLYVFFQAMRQRVYGGS